MTQIIPTSYADHTRAIPAKAERKDHGRVRRDRDRGGSRGYVCAIRAAQLALKTGGRGARDLGGNCLNVGCIPSKALLLHATHALHEVHENFEKMGIMGAKPTVDWERMLRYKDDVIATNTKGIEFLFKKNKITWLKGWGSIPAPGQVRVGDEVHSAKNIVIATGSEASVLPGITIDEEVIVTSTGALTLPRIPKSMVVIGAGVIGLEMGSVYARLGTEVTVVEYLDAITPGMDAEVAKTFQRILQKQGLKFVLGAAVQVVERAGPGARVAWKTRKDDKAGEIAADVVLVATGRKPFTAGLGLEALGVEMGPRGTVKTDAHFRTNINGLHAIGDAIAGPCWPTRPKTKAWPWRDHRRQARHVNYNVIPGVVYTTPEVAPWARPRNSSRNRAAPTRRASSASWATAAPRPCSRATAS